MTQQTPRFALPLLEAGQAQKELQHNEAIVALETLAQPIVEAVGIAAPPASPEEGASWIVAAEPTGAWSGQAGALATWSAGGWRFLAPIEGMAVFDKATGQSARFAGGGWLLGMPTITRLRVGSDQVVGARQPAIADPAGGAAPDAEARAAVASILAALRAHGLIET